MGHRGRSRWVIEATLDDPSRVLSEGLLWEGWSCSPAGSWRTTEEFSYWISKDGIAKSLNENENGKLVLISFIDFNTFYWFTNALLQYLLYAKWLQMIPMQDWLTEWPVQCNAPPGPLLWCEWCCSKDLESHGVMLGLNVCL